MKKLLTLLLLLIPLLSASAFTKDDIHIYTLENGLTLYFLQDTTTATVRLELNIRAGTSFQTPENAGLFELLARLYGLEITPDCVKTEKTAAPSQVEKILEDFASYFAEIKFSDSIIKKEYAVSKEQLDNFMISGAFFINAAIDTKVFSEAPWAHAGGINPSLFNSRSTEQVRTLIRDIQKKHYIPSKTELYISGNITGSTALSLTKKAFGLKNETAGSSLTSSKPQISEKNGASQKKAGRKFVITDDNLSGDLTQAVIQYRDFTQDEADLISQVFNYPDSQFKKLLLKQKNLAIRAPDYIDASSAQQSDSSRLVLQAILEKSKVSPAVQAELFLQMVREKNRISQTEIDRVIKEVNSHFTLVTGNSTLLMKNLAVFNQTNKDFSETLFNKNERLALINAEELNSKYENAEPFVFILCSTASYSKCAKEFSKTGWQRITSKNGAWYTLPEYSSALNKKNSISKGTADTDLIISAKRFIEENKSQFSSFNLKNNIPVTVKYTPQAQTAAIALTIDGGELAFAEKYPGLSSLLVNCLASNIQWQLDSIYSQGGLSSSPSVSAWTGNEYSLLTVNCAASDVNKCLETVSGCIIFGDIAPVLADSISYDLRSRWKIKTGTAEFQLLCAAVKTIYDRPFTNLYSDTDDKPVQMDFTDIAQAYPSILDPLKFSLVITGGVQPSEELKASLENSFGLLSGIKTGQGVKAKVKKLPLPQKTKRIQLRHLFFTDISADKAGPRPQILIPTTDFSDPLLYLLEGPDISSEDSALFNALLYLAGEKLQKKVSAEQTVKVTAPDADFPYAQVYVTKIKHTAVTDGLWAETVDEITAELEELINKDKTEAKELEKEALLKELENLWIINELEKTSANDGTAFLIQKGLNSGNAQAYLDHYKAVSSAGAEDFYLVFKSYFLSTPALRIYSADSKK